MIQLSNETLLAIQYGLSYLFCIAVCFTGPILSIIGTILTFVGDYLFNCGKDKMKAAPIYNISAGFEIAALIYYLLAIVVIVVIAFTYGILAWLPALCAVIYGINVLSIENKVRPFISILTAFVYSGFMIAANVI